MIINVSKYIISRLSLTLVLALVFSFATPNSISASSPKEGAMKTPTQNDEEFQSATRDRHAEMMAVMKNQDAELAKQIVEIKGAPDSKKMELLINLVSTMVAQRTEMHENMTMIMNDETSPSAPHLMMKGMANNRTKTKPEAEE